MPILTRDGRAALFVHVPKTGGTTIEQMLEDAGWQLSMKYTKTSDPGLLPYLRISPQHYHADLLRRILRMDQFDAVFMLVRDPIARFRSEYAMRSRRHGGDGSPEHVATWTDDVLDRYSRNPAVHDNHLRPQHEFLLRRAEVFRLEDGMPTVVDALNKRFDLGLTGEPPRRMQSSERSRLASTDVQLDATTEARLRSFYAEDYRAFGY